MTYRDQVHVVPVLEAAAELNEPLAALELLQDRLLLERERDLVRVHGRLRDHLQSVKPAVGLVERKADHALRTRADDLEDLEVLCAQLGVLLYGRGEEARRCDELELGHGEVLGADRDDGERRVASDQSGAGCSGGELLQVASNLRRRVSQRST